MKPFLIGLFMMFFLQMSGFNVMVFYCVPIFHSAGVSLDPHLASIMVGATLLLSCFVALAVVSQLGRKVVLVTSILGMAGCNILLGTCYHLRDTGHAPAPSYLGWLPVLAVVGFLFLGNVGYGTLIWVVTAELLPPKVREIVNWKSFISINTSTSAPYHRSYRVEGTCKNIYLSI